MAQDLFRVELGMEVESGPSFLVSDGVPGNDVYSNAALQGSWATDSQTGAIYTKKTAGTGTDKWETITTETLLEAAVGSQQWRDPVLVRDDTVYANIAAAQAAVNLGTIDGVAVATGDRILFTGISGQPKNVFIVEGIVGSGATLVEDPKKSVEEGDILSILNGTYDNQQHYYDGTNWISTGSDASAELGFIRAFIGKGAAGSETPTYTSNVYVSGNLEDAIGDLDAAVDANAQAITLIQSTASTLQTEVDAIETSLGSAINTDGTFNGYSGTSYIDSATSFTNADELLDDAAAANLTEINAIETSLGPVVNSSGVYVPHTSTNYIDGNSSITEDLLDLDAEILVVDSNNVSRYGDTMEPGANILFTGGGEVIGLPTTPSGPTAATSKSYVDSLTAGLVWVEPVWFIDVCSDEFGGAVTKDLQTPGNNTDSYLDTVESSDILICASGTGVTWTAVGISGNTNTLTGVNAGDGIRWFADADNGGANPEWQNMGHISDNAAIGSDEVDGHNTQRTRVGLDVATARSPGGTFAGMDNAILGLVVADFDGDASVTEYDALWAVDHPGGTSEVNTITADTFANVPAGSWFSLTAAVFGPNITGSTVIDPTNVADGGTDLYVWLDKTGSDSDPAPAGYAEGIQVDISGDTTADEVAASIRTAISTHRPQQTGPEIGLSVFWDVAGATDQIIVTDKHAGRASAAADGTTGTGFTFNRNVTGSFSEPDEQTSFYVANPDSHNFGNQFTYVNGDWILFGGSSGIVAGIGLSQTANVFNVNLGAGVKELPSDEVGVDVRPSAGLWTTNDGIVSSTLAGAQLGIKLDGSTLTMGANGIRVSSTITAEIDAIETSLGAMVNASGVYVPHSGTNYIDGNTDVTGDLIDLDAQIKTNETAITTANGVAANIQAEVDNIEAALGGMVDVNGDYVAHSGTNYIDGNADVTEDLTDLDAQIKTNEDDITSLENANGDEANIRDFIGKGAAGVETPVYSSTNIVTQNTDLETAIGELDDAYAKVAKQATITTSTTATLDSVLVDDVKVVKWIVHAQQGNKVTAVEVLATHDGQAAVDASDADHSTYAKLKLNGNIAGITFDVTVSGTGTGQTMNLRVGASASTVFTSVARVLV